FNLVLFYYKAKDGIRDFHVTGVQTCALPISWRATQKRLRTQLLRRPYPLRTYRPRAWLFLPTNPPPPKEPRRLSRTKRTKRRPRTKATRSGTQDIYQVTAAISTSD